jgi:hypothetical protein
VRGAHQLHISKIRTLREKKRSWKDKVSAGFPAVLAAVACLGGGHASAQAPFGWPAPGYIGLRLGSSSGLAMKNGQAQGYSNSYFDPNLSKGNGYAVSSGYSVRFGNAAAPAPGVRSQSKEFHRGSSPPTAK